MEKRDAAASLQKAAYPPRRLIAVHTGAVVAASLILSIISYVLNNTLVSSGGLSGMDTQAALSTAQVVLRLAQVMLTPFWSAGLCYAAIGICRGWTMKPGDLCEGFRKFKPLLSSGLMIGLQYVMRAIISFYLSVQLLMFTPFASPLYDAAAKLEEDPNLDVFAVMGDRLMPTMVAFLVIFLLVFAAVTLPIWYRYRMTRYLIVDGQDQGGLWAMMHSRAMMVRRRLDLMKLDLSFWWYYLLLALGMILCYGDLILSAVGVTLPFSENVAFWIFLCLGLLLQLAVKVLAGPKVAVTYAHRYENYLNEAPPAPKVKPIPDPEDLPWDY